MTVARLSAWIAAAALLTATAAGAGEDTLPLRPTDSLRFHERNGTLRHATFLSATAGSLRVEIEEQPTWVRLADVESLERKSSYSDIGAVVGLITGVTLALTLGDKSTAQDVLQPLVFIAIPGTLFGAAAGGRVERWTEVSVAPASEDPEP